MKSLEARYQQKRTEFKQRQKERSNRDLQGLNRDLEHLKTTKDHFATLNKHHELNDINNWLDSPIKPIGRSREEKKMSRTTKNLTEMM